MTTTTIATADYLIIAGFFAVMLVIGSYFGKRVKSLSQFFGGGKEIPWWLGGVSFFMVSFSALAFVMHSELVYKYGLLSLVLGWLPVLAAIISAVLFARRWRRVAQTSPLEYIEARYGSGMRQGLMWLGLPTRLLDDAIKLFAIGTLVSVGLGFPFEISIIACSLIILGYTFMGGLMAALVADFVQLAVIVAAVAILPSLAFSQAGGVSAVMEKLPDHFWNITRPDAGYPFSYLLCYFVLLFLNYSTSWSLVQRYYSTKDDKSAVKVGLLVAALYLVAVPLFYAPAFAAVVFLPGIENTKEVYPMICKTILPVGMFGMVIAAMFSATMSTLAGDCNAMSSVLTNDFYKRFIRKESSDRHLLVVARINTILVGTLVLGITLLMRSLQGSKDLFDTMAKVFGLFLPPVAIPMLLGMLTPRVSSTGAKWALTGGIVSGLFFFVLGAYQPWFRTAQALTFLTAGMTLAGLLLGSLLHPDIGEQKERVEAFFANLTTPERPASQTGTEDDGIFSFLPIIAGGIASMGVILIAVVILTIGFEKGRQSVYVGSGLLIAAFVIWVISILQRKKNA